MRPHILFLGTAGTVNAVHAGLSGGGFVIHSNSGNFHVDPGPGALIGLSKHKVHVDTIVITDPRFATDASLINAQKIEDSAEVNSINLTKQNGFFFKLPECSIWFVTEKPMHLRNTDVLIIATYAFSLKDLESLIKKIKPRLTVLTQFNVNKNAVYLARDLQKKFNCSVMSAADNCSIDLISYAALPEQQSLDLFREV